MSSRSMIQSLSPGIRKAMKPRLGAMAVRQASSSTASSSQTTNARSSDPAASTASGRLPMTWPEYLATRKQKRIFSTVATVPTTLAGMVGGGSYFAGLESEPGQLILGVEPIWVYGGATLGCMLLGYLLGPTVGSALHSLTHPALARGSPSPLEVMDRAFFEHLKKNRVSPAFQSANNPTPDYYGEKIVSLSTYRRWLRDQAAYKRKALHGVPDEQL